jgi:hypothetical protein
MDNIKDASRPYHPNRPGPVGLRAKTKILAKSDFLLAQLKYPIFGFLKAVVWFFG